MKDQKKSLSDWDNRPSGCKKICRQEKVCTYKSIKDKNTWFYIERTKTRAGVHKLGKDIFLNNNVLVVKFNNYGVLEEKLFYDKSKMNDHKFSQEITDNVITRGSFLESFLSIVKKFESSIAIKGKCQTFGKKFTP